MELEFDRYMNDEMSPQEEAWFIASLAEYEETTAWGYRVRMTEQPDLVQIAEDIFKVGKNILAHLIGTISSQGIAVEVHNGAWEAYGIFVMRVEHPTQAVYIKSKYER